MIYIAIFYMSGTLTNTLEYFNSVSYMEDETEMLKQSVFSRLLLSLLTGVLD